MKNDYANKPFSPIKSTLFYGWVVVFFGTLGVLMSIPGQTIGVSAFKEHLLSALGLENTQLSLAYLIGTISSGFLLTFAGKAYDKLGARIVAATSSFGLGMILITLSKSEQICLSLSKNKLFSPQVTTMIFMVFGFFFLRFFGQGVLTMVSRNMMMKWFKARRGLVNGISGVFITMGFASAPSFFNTAISYSSWQETWFYTGLFISIFFMAIVLIFFRDNPEECGLIEDGKDIHIKAHKHNHDNRCTPLKEAISTYSFWPFILAFSMSALYVTAITFHVEDIFKDAELSKELAFSLFVPSGIIGVFTNLIFGWASDKVKLKYINLVLLFGLFLSMIGILFLSTGFPYYLIIIGQGLAGGTFTVLMGVTWPRFYGRKHLGEISGFAMSTLVISSAIGPWLFSQSKTSTGSYQLAVLILALTTFTIMLLNTKADKPNLSA